MPSQRRCAASSLLLGLLSVAGGPACPTHVVPAHAGPAYIQTLPPAGLTSPVDLQPAPVAPAPAPECSVNFATPEGIRDVISNVLIRAEQKPESEVRQFLRDVKARFDTGDELRNAAAEHFKIDTQKFAERVEQWRHINCSHPATPGFVVSDVLIEAAVGAPQSPVPVSAFAADVTLHVVLHELGHAVIREFDLMVLGNEETMADAFATHFLIEHLPERAVQAITARVRSLMIEAGEVPRDQWPVRGEHNNDARRAFQIAALAVAADRDRYAEAARIVNMTDADITRAGDYGSDIHRAWRRTLAPLLMPEGMRSKEARVRIDTPTSDFANAGDPSLAATIESALKSIDWHSQVSVNFVSGAGGAAWNRSSRTITVNSEYVRRFIAQGIRSEAEAAPQP